MKIVDISWPLAAGMVSYKDRHPFSVQELRSIAAHTVADSLCPMLHLHAGTHVDAPSHMLEGGKTVEALSLEKMNGPCRVIDLSNESFTAIEAAHLLPHAIKRGERILLKTRNSMRSAFGNYDAQEVYLAASAAEHLASCGVLLVGVDALGLERNQPGYPSHMALFKADIIILEGARLGAVSAGSFVLQLLPLALVGTDAAPARAVLIEV